MIVVRVVVSNIFVNGLDYIYPFDIYPKKFTRVLIPVRNRKVIGIINEINPVTVFRFANLKTVIKVLDKQPVISLKAINLVQWITKYYQCTLYQSLKLAIPKYYFKKEQPQVPCEIVYKLNKYDFVPIKTAHKQKQVIDLLHKQKTVTRTEFIRHKVNLTTLKVLLKKNIISISQKRNQSTLLNVKKKVHKILTNEQQIVVNTIQSHLDHFKTFLLFGVTGSGKTNVYIEAIRPIIDAGKQVMILVPEIGLTPQTIKCFRQYFKIPIAVNHSKMNDRERFNLFLKVKNIDINILITTRSGVFYDMPNLGMIIVDEEHDASYKQKNNPTYHARNVAIMKAKIYNIPIILGSATPSIESYHHAINEKYHLLVLKKRALNQVVNQMHIINLQTKRVKTGLSTLLIQKIKQTLEKNEQTLIFVNRRGFAHSLICQKCGWCAECNQCEKPYTLHKNPQHLACHYCSRTRDIFLQCDNCQSYDLIDTGYGTEKIEEKVKIIFPMANIARLDYSSTQKQETFENLLDNIKAQHINIIIGTQMIAKGHDFKNVSLVAVLNADSGLYRQDFYAIERNAQLITQVAGRTGRREKPGNVYIQTYQPENPWLQLILKGSYEELLNYTLKIRKTLNYPPFSHQAYIYAQATQTNSCIQSLQYIQSKLVSYNQSELNCQISRVLPGINAKQAGHYRFMLMITGSTKRQLQKLLTSAYKIFHDKQHKNKNVKVSIDIDPIEIR